MIQPSNEVSYAELMKLWDTCREYFESEAIEGPACTQNEFESIVGPVLGWAGEGAPNSILEDEAPGDAQ